MTTVRTNDQMPLKLLKDQPGDLTLHIIYVWNFLQQYSSVHDLDHYSFKDIIVSLFYSQPHDQNNIIINLYHFLIKELLRQSPLKVLFKITVPIDTITVPVLAALVCYLVTSSYRN